MESKRNTQTESVPRTTNCSPHKQTSRYSDEAGKEGCHRSVSDLEKSTLGDRVTIVACSSLLLNHPSVRIHKKESALSDDTGGYGSLEMTWDAIRWCSSSINFNECVRLLLGVGDNKL